MCRKCDYLKADCSIYIEPLTKKWYLNYRIDKWDNINKCHIYEKVYINYCPWCGRPLSDGKV